MLFIFLIAVSKYWTEATKGRKGSSGSHSKGAVHHGRERKAGEARGS